MCEIVADSHDHSISVKDSISDLSESIKSLNRKILNDQASQNFDSDDLSRLKRRKERAERKLAILIKKNETQVYMILDFP